MSGLADPVLTKWSTVKSCSGVHCSARDLAERFAPVAAAYRLAPLVRGELEGSAQTLPARLGPLAALAGAGADQFALELCQPADVPLQHLFTMLSPQGDRGFESTSLTCGYQQVAARLW
jgi:hypothetical protein